MYFLFQVRGTVLKTLHSAEVEELPVIIKFLLQSVNNQDAVEVKSISISYSQTVVSDSNTSLSSCLLFFVLTLKGVYTKKIIF